MFKRLLPLVLLLLLCVPISAEAGRIPPSMVLEAERIDDTRTGVWGNGLGEIVLDIETTDFPELWSRTRRPDSQLGPGIDLSRTANAEIPRNVTFSRSGNLFLSWGVATTEALGEFTSRPKGGTFSATQTYTAPPCGRFQSVSAKPDGGLLLACSAEVGIAPNNNVILVSSLPNFLSTSFEAEVTAQAGTDDPFLQPLTSTAPDGSMAVAWSTRRESAPGIYSTRIRALVSGDGDWFGSPTTNLAFVNSATGYVSGAYPLSLAGGKVAVLWREGDYSDPSFGRLHLGIMNSVGTIETTAIITAKPTDSYSIVRQGEGLLIAWSETDGGMGDPYTTKTVSYDQTSGFSAATTLEENSESAAGSLQTNNKGDVLLPRGNSAEISAWVRPAGSSSFAAPQTIQNYAGSLPPDQRMSGTSLSLDARGDVLATWILVDDVGQDRALWGGLDSTRPSLRVQAPKKVRRGKIARFKAKGLDTSGIRTIRWKFGRVSKSGKSVTYRYKKPGRYRYQVTATDRAGNKKTVQRFARVR